MKIILKENVENLGRKGDLVEVSPGYGRNYLIPKKLALEVTSSNLKMIEIERQALLKRVEQERLSFQELIQKLNEVSLTFHRKAGEKDVIFGSVSSSDIKEGLEKLGFEIDKKKVLLDEPIKRLGNYTVPIKVFYDDRAEIKVEVVREGEVKEEKAKEEKEKKEDKRIKEAEKEAKEVEKETEEVKGKEEERGIEEAKEEAKEEAEAEAKEEAKKEETKEGKKEVLGEQKEGAEEEPKKEKAKEIGEEAKREEREAEEPEEEVREEEKRAEKAEKETEEKQEEENQAPGEEDSEGKTEEGKE